MNMVYIGLTTEESEALLYVLAQAYERALETAVPQDRMSGATIRADEPLPAHSSEEAQVAPSPSASLIKLIEKKVLDSWTS